MSTATKENNVMKFRRAIPSAKVNLYINAGFSVIESRMVDEGQVVVEKNVVNKTGRDSYSDYEFRKPYLVQRGAIHRPLGKYEGVKLTSAVDMDYMGAAEFEFGALPLSLRRIQAQMQLFQQYKLDSHKVTCEGHDYVLRVFANFDTDEQKEQYEGWLHEIAADTVRLKEHTGFEIHGRGTNFPKIDRFGTDFWWDIKNDVMFSFDKNFMNRIERHLKKSFDYMDSQ